MFKRMHVVDWLLLVLLPVMIIPLVLFWLVAMGIEYADYMVRRFK